MSSSQGKEKFCFPIVVEQQENGYFAYCPSLVGCYTDGPSYEILMRKMKQAVVKEVKKFRDKNEPVPSGIPLMLTVVEVEA